MADYLKLKPFILKWEGGFVNDPYDLGGATNKGITYETYKAYFRKKGYPVPTIEMLQKMPDIHWNEIFKIMCWDKWKADQIKSQSVANILVDWLWASGSYGIKIPQQLLKVTIDGIVGNKTILAVNEKNPKELFDEIKEERKAFIERICISRPANNRYKKGWLNRINDIKFE